MSNIAAPFHGLATELHKTASIGGTIDSSSKIAEVASVGTLELSANIIEFNSYGSDFKRKLVGQKDSGTLSLTLNFVPGETSHADLKALYDNGSAQTFAVRWISGSENATAEFTGYVASFSMETPAEDIVTATVELAIDGGVTFDLSTAV
tara:strand:+ start:65 stop:514 length:450 start_codon:yes stop_codon:yes gene_type:complete